MSAGATAIPGDDTALTSQELTAVVFARKLTRAPGSITDADYTALRKEFGDDGRWT